MNKPLALYPGAKPCVRCAACCRKVSCGFGVYDFKKGQCVYLKEDGIQTLCAIYEKILELPVEEWEASPAFGAGCCMGMFNEHRTKIINELEKKHE